MMMQLSMAQNTFAALCRCSIFCLEAWLSWGANRKGTLRGAGPILKRSPSQQGAQAQYPLTGRAN